MVRETRTNLSHNIFTSMNLCYGASLFGRFPQWSEMGLTSVLERMTSAAATTWICSAMNGTFLVHKEVQFDNNLWSPQAVIEMGTLDGQSV
jgi:hypothetical protein